MRNFFGVMLALALLTGAAQAQKIWNFDTAGNNEGWTQGSGITSFATSGGSLNVGHNASDPNIYSPDFNASAIVGNNFRWIKIDLEATVTGDYQIFFIRTDRGINETDSFFFRVTAGRQLYQIHVPRRLDEVGKNGTDLWLNRSIRQFRFDFADGVGTVKIHSFTVEALPHPYWDFNIVPGLAVGHASGWVVASQITNFGVTASGTLNMNINGTDPYFQVDPLNFDPNSFRYMYIRQNHTGFPNANPATAQTFAFPGTGGTGFVNKDWRHYPNNGWSTILLDMHTRTANASWAGAGGSISTLRVDPYQSTDTNAALYSYDAIGLRTAADLGSATVTWPAMAGAGTWVSAKHSPYAGSAVALAGGVATLTQGTGGQPMAMMNQDFLVNSTNRYLYLDIEAETTTARNNLELRVMWAADGEDFATGNRQRQYTAIRTKQGSNRYVFDLGTAQSAPYNGGWSGFPHGLLLQFGTGDADLSWVKVANAGLLAAAPPQIDFVDAETGNNNAAYAKTMTLAAGTGITWSLISPPSGMTINSSSGAISWPSPVPNTTPYTITVRATNAAGTDDEVFTLAVSDVIPPVITRNGPASVTVECGSLYEDAGATATDNPDGDITGNIVPVNPVNTSIPGPYTVTYNVSDAAGNPAVEVTRSVTVEDTLDPAVTITGGNAKSGECGVALTLPVATALDACDGALPAAVTDLDGLNPANPAAGVYNVEYGATDGEGNTGTSVLVVTITDTLAPLVTITGGTLFGGECGVALTLPGATALDGCSGALSVDITDLDGLDALNPARGFYGVVYSATDGASNTGTETLFVTIADSVAPVVTIEGGNTLAGECGVALTLPGAAAVDGCDGALPAGVTDLDGLNAAHPAKGVYNVVYGATDGAGLEGTDVLVVTITDTADPVVTIPGPNPINTFRGFPFTPPEVTAQDACDGALAVTPSGSVDMGTPGQYTLTYTAEDAEGNTAQEELVVNVSNDLPPVITLLGDASVTLDCGDTYTDAGATAADIEDGDLTGDIVVAGLPPAGMLAPGVWTVTYNVSDSILNAAATVTRTVTVLENCDLAAEVVGKTLVRRKLNERAEFTVLVTGAAGNPQYQWSKEVFSKADKAFSDIPGADGPTYVINAVQASDEGRYVCRVTDSVTTVYGPVYTLMLGSEPVTERVPAAGMTGLAALAALLGACGAAARRRRK